MNVESMKDRIARRTGLLANSPKRFHGCGGIDPRRRLVQQPYSMTNMGLRIELPLQLHKETPDQYIGVLDCVYTSIEMQSVVGIMLLALPQGAGHLQYTRILPEMTLYLDNVSYKDYPLRTILVKQKTWNHRLYSNPRWINIQPVVCRSGTYKLTDVWPAERWNKSRQLLRITQPGINLNEPLGAFWFESDAQNWFGEALKNKFVLILGYGESDTRSGCALWYVVEREGSWTSWQDIKNNSRAKKRWYVSAGEQLRLEIPWPALDLTWEISNPLGVEAVINVMLREPSDIKSSLPRFITQTSQPSKSAIFH